MGDGDGEPLARGVDDALLQPVRAPLRVRREDDLVGGVKRLRTNDGQLSLVCSDRNITKIFEITGLDRVFTIYPTREEAVSKISPSA